MRIDADLNLLHAEFAKSRRLRLTNHYAIGYYLYVEQKLTRFFNDCKKVAAEEHFAAAEGEKKDLGISELDQQIEDFFRRHFAVIVVVEVAVYAPLIAAIGEIEVDAQGHTQIERSLIQLGKEAHRGSGAGEELTNGDSDTTKMPCRESSSTK